MKLFVICSVFPLVLASPTPAPIHPRSSFVSHLNSAPGLSDLAKKAGLKYFGTAVDNVVLDNDGYTSIAFKRSEFNQVTASNGQKWVHTEPQRDFFNYTLGDQIVDASKEADQIRRCHTFLWHNQLPTWLTTGTWTKASLLTVLENHIKNLAEYYWDDCYAWDVVNEAFNDDGTLRKTIWLDAIGPEYIEHAFRLARQYASPGTKLYYNDYGIERVNNKSLAIARMIREYQGVGVPIDGVGLQAHFTVGRAPLYTDIRASQQLFSSLGLETALTELDVRMTLPDNANKTAAQATIYADSVRACADEESCVGVTVWDFWDTVSWVPETFIGEGNACLWNQNLQRKPAYYAVADVLRRAGEKRG